jgi:hypothetical protein
MKNIWKRMCKEAQGLVESKPREQLPRIDNNSEKVN